MQTYKVLGSIGAKTNIPVRRSAQPATKRVSYTAPQKLGYSAQQSARLTAIMAEL